MSSSASPPSAMNSKATKEVPGRYAFGSPSGSPDHHLYVCAEDNPELHRHLVFRDYLRRHSDEAAAYGKLKQQLAQEDLVDRGAYSDGKNRLDRAALRLAHQETK